MTAAASTLFIIGNVPLSNEPVMADSDVIFESIGNMNTFESILWDEIYEYIFSYDPKFKGFSSILPQKIYHASLLQEQGLNSLGTKYTDYLSSSVRKLPKKDILTINLTRELSEVASRLSESNTGWLAKPKLSSVWGQLDKSFNKYIGGDDIDALNKKMIKRKFLMGSHRDLLPIRQLWISPKHSHLSKLKLLRKAMWILQLFCIMPIMYQAIVCCIQSLPMCQRG